MWRLCCVLLAAACWASDLRGIYIYTNDVSQITKATATQLTAAIGIPGVDGVAVVIGWDAIEPAMGQFQWTLLDQWIGQASGAGRKIDLVVMGGGSTPAWLFQAGAKPLSFTISPHAGATGACDSEVIAAPWDAVFLARWDAVLAAVAAHLKAAGTYDAVTLVRLTGVNRTTEELRLPAETAQSTGLACVSNAVATWQQAGYKPSLLMQGWNAILDSFEKSFPDKFFSVSLIPTSAAFPPIAEDGTLITGARPDLTQQLLGAASQKFPERLVVQFDFLMPGEAPSPDVIQAAQKLGTMAAFQTNEYLGGQGAACGEPVTNPVPCTSATYLMLLETGIYPLGTGNALRAQYIEVFHDNASAFPDDILKAHYELAPPVITSVTATIAPNMWVEIKGEGLSLTGDTRIWKAADFVGNQLPTGLDGVSATVNGKAAYVYYISPSQVNVLTTPDAMTGAVPVQVTVNGTASAAFTAQAQAIAPLFFVFNGGPYVAATHANGSLIGTASPATPGETVVLYGNGFGSSPTLSPTPVIQIGGTTAAVQFAGLVAPGEFQFNVVVPGNSADGDLAITATYNGVSTQKDTVITVKR